VNDIIKPGAGVLFMKVGTHANEPLADIIARKQAEIEAAGFALWGYGGNTCHPVTMVQPFAHDFELRGEAIHLVMQPMESSHFAVSARAEEMSTDAIEWQPIPEPINVLGSRFALAINDLQPVHFELPLSHTRVAIGNQQGRRGDEYVKGRVDKAVLEVVEDDPEELGPEPEERQPVEIGLVAELVKPYAVFVRN
jgi:hypothetical protein